MSFLHAIDVLKTSEEVSCIFLFATFDRSRCALVSSPSLPFPIAVGGGDGLFAYIVFAIPFDLANWTSL